MRETVKAKELRGEHIGLMLGHEATTRGTWNKELRKWEGVHTYWTSSEILMVTHKKDKTVRVRTAYGSDFLYKPDTELELIS